MSLFGAPHVDIGQGGDGMSEGTWSPVVIGVCLADVREERIAWRSRGRVARGKLTVIDGDPGLGKSTVMMDWAARVSRGDPLPDGEPQEERGVLLLCAEDDPADTIRPRLRLMGADLSQIYLLNEVPDERGMRMAALPTDCDLIEAIIRARNVGLVVIDPLTAFLAEDLKANSDQDVRRALSPLALVAQRTGASVILLRHLNKTASVNALYRGGGSIGIIGIARFGLLVAEDRNQGDDVRILASTKSNVGPPPASLAYRLRPVPGEDHAVIEWIGTSELRARDLLTEQAADDETRDEWDDAVEWLRGFLSDGPRPAKEVYAEGRKVGIGYRAIRRAKAKLGVRAVKKGFQGDTEWQWTLSESDESLNGVAHESTDPSSLLAF